ncbi:hypothetical protein [Microbacterium paludicola]|uniref:hypothetical protein n=1 Tax=Microbacterium paludicola TaxID=300019 RepID=UPI001642F863|nr:hypothetical protein [Microbacterium paludicola]
MTIAEVPAEARAAMRARRRKEIDDLDYRRELRRLEEHGYSQTQISKWLGITQPSVLSALRTAAKVPMPLEGFSGATPYEICQRYAGGIIDRAQLVDELTRFPYVEGGRTDGYDSLIVDPAGTWSEVSDARRRGLIENDVYEEVFNRRHNVGPVAEKKVASRKGSTKDLAILAARGIARAIGGGEVTEKNGRIIIKTKDGVQLEVKGPRGGLSERNSLTGKGYAVRRVPSRKVEKVSKDSEKARAHLRTGE